MALICLSLFKGSKDLVDFVLCLIDSLPKLERRKARLFFIIYDGKVSVYCNILVEENLRKHTALQIDHKFTLF